MFGALLVLFLQATTPEAATAPAAAQAPAAQQQAAIAPGTMDCEYNRATRVRICTTATGEVLRCRRERVLGSRLPTQVCLTFR